VDVVVSRGPVDIRVPAVVGLRHEDARLRLEAAGLKVGNVRTRDGGRGPAGLVLDQQPAAGILAPRGARVHLVLAGEPP
jgi:serine/threonine-protein kinase